MWADGQHDAQQVLFTQKIVKFLGGHAATRTADENKNTESTLRQYCTNAISYYTFVFTCTGNETEHLLFTYRNTVSYCGQTDSMTHTDIDSNTEIS